MNGNEAQDEVSFIKQIYKIMNFPDEKNSNWDAFVDWMRDLSWIKQRRVILVISNWNDFLCNGKDKEFFIQDLNEDILPFWINEKMYFGSEEPDAKTLDIYVTDDDVENIKTMISKEKTRLAIKLAKSYIYNTFKLDLIGAIEIQNSWIFTAGDNSSPMFGNPRIIISKEDYHIENLNLNMLEIINISKSGKTVSLE